MPTVEVTKYYLRWKLGGRNSIDGVKKGEGWISLYDVNGNTVDMRYYDDPLEFQLISELLRNEKPLWFETDQKKLMTGWQAATGEPVGEAES